MRRRDFLGALSGTMAGWPLAAGAQAGKLPTIGLLGAGTPKNWSDWTSAFVHRLSELGWIEGRTIKVEYRWATTMNSAVRAIYTCPDPVMNASHAQINNLALAARLPTFHPFRDYLNAGGFMSYGANNTDWFRRAADYVDKILRGSKAADLPVEQPTKFELVINLKTGKELGFAVSPALLARADEVIE